jgi:8-oxo-dGTP pyrophosphatase MutT (NUDIX family)
MSNCAFQHAPNVSALKHKQSCQHFASKKSCDKDGSMTHKSASTVVLNEDHTQVLLLLREDFHRWTLPGGHIESDEMPEQAAIRETFEETGYHIAVDSLVGTYARPTMPGGGDIKYVFLGHVVGGAPIERGPETLRVD